VNDENRKNKICKNKIKENCTNKKSIKDEE
jgi:hypothetical protein